MKDVAKYNTAKGVSTALTFGTPLATILTQGDLIVHRSETALSFAGIITLFIMLLFMKDKIFEYFKAPSALVLSSVLLILVILLENIILPVKYVCISTMVASGVDEITFKRWYKQVEERMPDISKNYKHVGFIFAKTNTILEADNEQGSRH